jgi:hypothetical protein
MALADDGEVRTTSLLLTVTLASLLGTVACGPAPSPTNKQAGKGQGANKQGSGKTAPPAEASKVETAKAADPVAPPPVTPPVDPNPDPDPTPEPDAALTGGEPEPAAQEQPPPAEPAPSGGAWSPPAGADIRSDAVVPPGTPAANATAFKRLPQAKTDGPPVSNIAGNGLHFDVMVVGRGWEKSRCVEPTARFDPETDDRVNLCLRVVHPKDAEEVLSVEWVKAGGKATRRSTITVKPIHAYLTRGYLPIKSGYSGDWVATIKAPDGTVLAELPFTID